ncbi:MAG: Periplasmic aromatic aldehyde oxidoreductase, FAD binding subunit YagS, partial [uncultured Gemmatimonadaceae bacterium]
EGLHLRARRQPGRRRQGGRRAARRQVHRRRHQPARPDEARHRTAGAPGGREPDRPGRGRADARGRPPHRRAGAQRRPRGRPAGQARLRSARPRVAGGRLRPAPQPRDHGRQPAAAHPLPVLLRDGDGLQQAPARLRLRGVGGAEPRQRRAGRERRLHRRPPVRHGGGHAGAGRGGGDGHAGRGHAGDPDRRPPPAARRRAIARDEPAVRRTHHGGGAAAAGPGTARLPQGARPRLLRLRHGVAGGRAGARRRRQGRGGPLRLRRARPQALAGGGGRAGGGAGAGRGRRRRPRGRPDHGAQRVQTAARAPPDGGGDGRSGREGM